MSMQDGLMVLPILVMVLDIGVAGCRFSVYAYIHLFTLVNRNTHGPITAADFQAARHLKLAPALARTRPHRLQLSPRISPSPSFLRRTYLAALVDLRQSALHKDNPLIMPAPHDQRFCILFKFAQQKERHTDQQLLALFESALEQVLKDEPSLAEDEAIPKAMRSWCRSVSMLPIYPVLQSSPLTVL